MNDTIWMKEALLEAVKGRNLGEVPVGAVVVKDGQVIARACNQPVSSCNPVAHAEILALQSAAAAIGNYRLLDCDLYVTLEPCTMCAGAIVHSRIRRLIYGTAEPRAGAIVSAARVLEQPQMNHRVEVTGGVLKNECSKMISEFFRVRRKQIREARRK
ncbi:tRNA adenosine(34) deaminase TadA [Endozoicomonas sp. ONNA2]|uniref:tRNA adenosine(34) deaminase TadA n=1 Tax=Endozoicomonas sp. ONNA2 TaxID=2828741 RepID=UPI002148D245|nr:tRNA adenosine(34) deaminase TadA [Endozoicomonas sp. ONNA2]